MAGWSLVHGGGGVLAGYQKQRSCIYIIGRSLLHGARRGASIFNRNMRRGVYMNDWAFLHWVRGVYLHA